ncbi:hypothetical protein [Parabacteroides sp. AM58-2XD]|uniref:hypothetical protein n=1 Tax=Parabacteroides sp. AM58-2XD TaxID=2292362 RepID=UPI001F3018EA|nr:hypothetical protein [Parabacteroides sp. AM58-2XD]
MVFDCRGEATATGRFTTGRSAPDANTGLVAITNVAPTNILPNKGVDALKKDIA